MDIKEIRIGNYLDNCGDIVKVVGIQPNGYSVRCDDKDGCLIIFEEINNKREYENDSNEFKGVELTEKYLLMFGLEVIGESGIMKQWNFGTNPLTKDYLFPLVWMKNIDGKSLDELFYQNAHFQIKYIHQLQNLFFALTQKELELAPQSTKHT